MKRQIINLLAFCFGFVGIAVVMLVFSGCASDSAYVPRCGDTRSSFVQWSQSSPF